MRKRWWVLIAAAAVPATGVLYQKLGEQADRSRYSKTGTLVHAGSSSLYMQDAAPRSEDATWSGTVVFESGIGATCQNWAGIQSVLAGSTRTLSYDRAGLGWSEESASPPTPVRLAYQLLALLTAAEVPGPYLLVAHSFGGLVARHFAAAYPDAVAGLVLVDPMRAEDWPPLNPERDAFVARGIRLARVGRSAARFGLMRLFMHSTLLGSGWFARLICRLGGEPAQTLMERMLCEVGKMPRDVWPNVVANWSRPEFFRTLEAYLVALPEAVQEASSLEPLRVPVTVLTPASATPLTGAQLRALSSRAGQIIAPRSAHWVHLDEPELVLGAIQQIMASTANLQPS